MKNKKSLIIFVILLFITACQPAPSHTHEYINGICSCGDIKDVEEKYKVIFKDYDDTILKEVEVTSSQLVTPPSDPIREGYEFKGWSEDFSVITSDLIIYAIYEKEKIIVGENQKFKSIQEAIDNAKDTDIIYIEDGLYQGAVINKKVELIGSNNTIINSDIIINSSDVIINGVQLTDKAKFTFDNLEKDVENIKILNCKITNSTVNVDMNRNTAPFNFVSNNGFIIKNILVDNCTIDKVSEGRPMAFYIVDVEGLTIQNSTFYGGVGKKSYNDAIKVDNKENGKSTFGIKGNVIIKNNIFKNYSQYAIWFRQFSNGTYLIENNYFDNIGQTEQTHAAINFIEAVDCDNININVNKNTIVNSYLLFRIDKLNNNDNVSCDIMNNVVQYSNDSCFIKNSVDSLSINANNNYYGLEYVNDDNFIGNVDYSNYYSNLYDVPGFQKFELKYETNSYLEIGETVKIEYECYGRVECTIKWISLNENIAVVNEVGEVTGLTKGTVEIKAVSESLNIEKVIIFEVYENVEELSEVEQFILSVMNNFSSSVTAATSRTNYGLTNPYYYSLYRSATSFLFEDLDIDTDSYARDGLATLVNDKVEYITIHDTWALNKNGEELAQFFLNDETSVHYTVGNDGIFQIIRLTDKGAHAGDSPYRAYALDKTEVVATTDNPVITMIDGYFAINGIKTNLRPYTDYEGLVQDTNNYTTDQITYSGIRCIIGEDGYYYLGKTYFNETYQTISNFGGNANSLAIEMSTKKGVDFYQHFFYH